MDDHLARVLAAAAACAALLAGCGGSSERASTADRGAPAPGPTPSPASSPPPAEPPAPPAPGAPPAASGSYEVWFMRSGKLFETTRTAAATPAVAARALKALAAGPTTAEAGAGVTSAVPALTVKGVANGIATVEAPDGFARDRARAAQVVYTLTQYPTVRRVLFTGSTEPVGRSDYDDLAPPITVATPQIGGRVSSPVRISGTADTFEATVSMRILDARGDEVAKGFTTATCGSGCRGRYTTTLAYKLAQDQRGVVEVYEDSAENGQRIHVVDIPVTLSKSG